MVLSVQGNDPAPALESFSEASAPEQDSRRTGGRVEPERPHPPVQVWVYRVGWAWVGGSRGLQRDTLRECLRREPGGQGAQSPRRIAGAPPCPWHPSPPSMLHARHGFLKPLAVGVLVPTPDGKVASLLTAGAQEFSPLLCAQCPGPVVLSLFISRTLLPS